jgi:hypothetical protein
MHFDAGRIQRNRLNADTHHLLALQLLEYPIKDACLAPAAHAGVNGVPVTKAFRQTTPFAAVLCHVQDGIEHITIAQPDVAALHRQRIFDLFVLLFGEFYSWNISLNCLIVYWC